MIAYKKILISTIPVVTIGITSILGLHIIRPNPEVTHNSSGISSSLVSLPSPARPSEAQKPEAQLESPEYHMSQALLDFKTRKITAFFQQISSLSRDNLSGIKSQMNTICHHESSLDSQLIVQTAEEDLINAVKKRLQYPTCDISKLEVRTEKRHENAIHDYIRYRRLENQIAITGDEIFSEKSQLLSITYSGGSFESQIRQRGRIGAALKRKLSNLTQMLALIKRVNHDFPSVKFQTVPQDSSDDTVPDGDASSSQGEIVAGDDEATNNNAASDVDYSTQQ